jgi:hypothetical protein
MRGTQRLDPGLEDRELLAEERIAAFVGGGEVRPRPLSSLTWTRAGRPEATSACARSTVQTDTSASASSAIGSSSSLSAPSTRMRTSSPTPARSSRASSAVATANQVAPPRSAACALGTIPWP